MQKETEVRNFGIPGANTARILREELTPALKFRPTLTILLAGTNDTCNSHALISAEESCRNIRHILEAVRGIGSECVLMTPPPFCPELLLERHSPDAYGMLSPERRMEEFRGALTALAAEWNVVLLDLVPFFLTRDLRAADSFLTNPQNSPWRDGLHPNREGYRLIADRLAETIAAHGWNCERIACLGDSITYGQYMPGAGTAEGGTYPAILKERIREAAL